MSLTGAVAESRSEAGRVNPPASGGPDYFAVKNHPPPWRLDLRKMSDAERMADSDARRERVGWTSPFRRGSVPACQAAYNQAEACAFKEIWTFNDMNEYFFISVITLFSVRCAAVQALADLSYHTRTNSIAQTNHWGGNPLGHNGAESIFLTNSCLMQYPDGNPSDDASTNWATTQPLVRNANFWLHFAPEITAIPERFATPVTGGANAYKLNGQGGFFAISPRHILTVDHMLGAGNTNDQNLLFIDDKGSNVVRWLIGVVQLSAVDLDVGILNADLPPTVHPFKVLPAGYTNYLPELIQPGLRGQVQLVCCDQWRTVKPALWQMSAYNTGFYLVYFNDNNPAWLGTNGNRTHVGGDSGCPIMALVGTNLVCVTGYDSSAHAPDVSGYIPDINTSMHYLSTNFNLGSDYQVATCDLSRFQPYRPLPPVNLHVIGQ
jgi:hypothetical protein